MGYSGNLVLGWQAKIAISKWIRDLKHKPTAIDIAVLTHLFSTNDKLLTNVFFCGRVGHDGLPPLI